MAKRVRGSSTRPGQRRRLQRSSAPRPRVETPPSSAPSTSLTPAEEARAAELEAQIVAAEKETEAASSRSRERGRRATESESRIRTGSIAMRASEEYGYVARDVRRLIIIGGSLIAFLVVLWVVTQATGAGPF
jgi:hypothetical protein